MDVFVVQHTHKLEDGGEDVKLVGVYSSEERAREAVDRLSRKPGFRDHPDSFQIDRYRVDSDQWTEGFVAIRSR
jgi:hypothetical protein